MEQLRYTEAGRTDQHARECWELGSSIDQSSQGVSTIAATTTVTITQFSQFSCFLPRWLYLLQFCWRRKQSPAPARTSLRFCSPPPPPPKAIQIPQGCSLPTDSLVHVLTVEPRVVLFLFCFPLFFFFFNLNKECSGPHLRDFWAPFQKLLGLSSSHL